MGNRTLSGQVDPDDATISATTKANLNDNYTLKPNGLNQYLTKENKSVRVVGTVAENAAVAAQGSIGTTAPVAKKDRAYSVDLLSLNNVSGPARGGVTVFAALPGQGSGGSDLLSTRQRNWEVPQQTQTMSYDADGNLTGDGVWTYTYDAENRLVGMETITAAVTAGLRYRLLEFKYDYMGRRVQKRSKQGVFGASPATDTYTGFAYDGWNLIAEFTIDNPTTAPTCGTMLRSYTWGLDVAGSTSATGGIGALVQIVDHGANKTYFPTYDGSGNLAALVDAADGTLAAVYEYSPYGELLRIEGPYASINPFRFSTKFSDVETGLSYYGHRYYHAGLGRFINRDPIEERGGINLYAFTGNNPWSRSDYLGLDSETLVLDKVVVGKDDVGLPSGFPSGVTLYEYTLNNWFPHWVYTPVYITGATFSLEPPKPKAPAKLSKKDCDKLLGRTQILTKQLVGIAADARDQALTVGYAERLSLEHQTAMEMLEAVNLGRAIWKVSTVAAGAVVRFAAARQLQGLHMISALGTPFTNAEVAKSAAVYAVTREAAIEAGEHVLGEVVEYGTKTAITRMYGDVADVLGSSGLGTVNYAKAVTAGLESSYGGVSRDADQLRELYRARCQ